MVMEKREKWGVTAGPACGATPSRISPCAHSTPKRNNHPHPPTQPPKKVIFGRGNASIGLHFDKDNVCAGGSRQPVATYLAISSGRKLALLLPPDQTLLPPGGDSQLLLKPTAEFLRAVKAAGGHFFVLEDVGAAAAAAGSSAAAGAGSSVNGAAAGSSAGAQREFSATALFMPRGWWHWVVGLTDWHVVYGGSFYPDIALKP